jgi:hypothetical protein
MTPDSGVGGGFELVPGGSAYVDLLIVRFANHASTSNEAILVP